MLILWWIGDLIMIAAVAPLAVYLEMRIVRALGRAHAALLSVHGSAEALAGGLPPALGEVVSAVQAVEGLVP